MEKLPNASVQLAAMLEPAPLDGSKPPITCPGLVPRGEVRRLLAVASAESVMVSSNGQRFGSGPGRDSGARETSPAASPAVLLRPVTDAEPAAYR